MALQGKAMGFIGLDEGWDFAEGTGQHLTPLPPEDETPAFTPVVCVVSSISQLRPEDLAFFSAPNLAMGTSTDFAVPSDAWFQDLRGTASDKSIAAAPLPAQSPKPEFSPEIVSGAPKPESKRRSLWQRICAR